MNLRPPVLKRKKRFVCLLTLAALIKAKRERTRLKEEMESLRRQALYNALRSSHRVSASGVGNTRYPNTRTGGAGSTGASAAAADAIEIHIMPGGENGGIVAGNSEREISAPFISRTSAGGTIENGYIRPAQPETPGVVASGGRLPSGGYRNLNHRGIGTPGVEGTNTHTSPIGRGIAGAGTIGPGVSASELERSANFALGNGGFGGRLGGNSGIGPGILGPGIFANGGRNLNTATNSHATISSVAAATRRRTRGGGSSATVVGVVGTTTRGSGIPVNSGSGGFDNEGGPTNSGVLVGGVSTAAGTRNANDVNVGVGAIAATLSDTRSGAPGIGGRSSALSGGVGSVTGGNVGGNAARAGRNPFASGISLGTDTDGDSNFESGVYGVRRSNRDLIDFDDDEEGATSSRYNTGLRG